MKNPYLAILIFLIMIFSGCTQQPDSPSEQAAPHEPLDETPLKPEPDAPIAPESETIEEPVQIEEPEETDPNLVLYLKFDEEGENIIDSASGLNGTIVGSLERTEGKIDNALYFNGESYVDLSNALESVSDLSEGTIAFWFNYESTLDEQLIMPIFYIGNSDTGDPDSMFIIEIGHAEFADSGPKLNPSHKPLYVTWTDNEAEPFLCFDSRNNIEENKWHHFAVVLSQNGNTGYLNGEEMTERRYNFSRASNKSFLDSISNKELFTLGYGKGNKELSPEFTYFKGKIDDLRIYNKPLSSTEITELTSSN